MGVGNAASHLGNASAVLQAGQQPLLMIDCGHTALNAFQACYQSLPEHVFITHLHFDHIGGLESLFYQAFQQQAKPTLFVPHWLVSGLCQRVADYPGNLAEGGQNFWDLLRLVPVSQAFWLHDMQFRVHAVRHHAPQSAFGLQLPGQFFYTGDTRPIPEILHHESWGTELIFHDVGVTGNPSHTGVEDVWREYRGDVIQRLRAYHYGSAEDGKIIQNRGIQIVGPDTVVPLGAHNNQEGATKSHSLKSVS